MKRKLQLLALTLLLPLAVFAQGKVTVVIDYGDVKPTETMTVEWTEGMTALVALQSCADVETHPIEKYIFVESINDVKQFRGIKAWYYTVNNEQTGTLAVRKVIKPGDTVTWLYKTDVCSATVDNKKKE